MLRDTEGSQSPDGLFPELTIEIVDLHDQQVTIPRDANVLYTQEDLRHYFGYDYAAEAIAELYLASSKTVDVSERARVLLCRDPEEPSRYGLLDIAPDSTVRGEVLLGDFEERDAVFVLGAKRDQYGINDAMPGLSSSSISGKHVGVCFEAESIIIADLNSVKGTQIRYRS